MCSCHSILECCVTFSGVKLSIRSFVLCYLVNVGNFASFASFASFWFILVDFAISK